VQSCDLGGISPQAGVAFELGNDTIELTLHRNAAFIAAP